MYFRNHCPVSARDEALDFEEGSLYTPIPGMAHEKGTQNMQAVTNIYSRHGDNQITRANIMFSE